MSVRGQWMGIPEAWESLERRYLTDPVFHARIDLAAGTAELVLAEHGFRRRLTGEEAELIRYGATLGVAAAELPVESLAPSEPVIPPEWVTTMPRPRLVDLPPELRP